MDPGSGQAPLADAILCCSALKTEERDEIHKIATELGARCSFDLAIENTHLIVGDSRTPKYRYVARDRPDMKVLLPSFVQAVRDSWVKGGVVDLEALEKEHKAPALHGLSICLTGFNEVGERSKVIKMIVNNGASYEGDLSRHTTSHLIARTASGKKYQMAPLWDIAVVGEEWLRDSIERGMSLDESLYALTLAPQARGEGAWNRSYQPGLVSPGKRRRDESTGPGEHGRRKLRRTMSSKLSGEHAAIWANIASLPEAKAPRPTEWQGNHQTHEASKRQAASVEMQVKPGPKLFSKPRTPGSIFSGVTVYLHDFQRTQVDILQTHLGSNGAVCVESRSATETESSTETVKFLMLPASVPLSKISPIPSELQNIPQVTEWWLEACLHSKGVVEPSESRFYEPFFKQKLPGFEKLKIASTALDTMERLNLSRAVKLLGATYDETIQAGISVVITNKSSTKPNRIDGALKLGLPVVRLEWLFACIRACECLSFDRYSSIQNASRNTQGENSTHTISFSTTRTLTIPTGATERRISARTSGNSKVDLANHIENDSSVLCDDDVRAEAIQLAANPANESLHLAPLSPPESQHGRQMQPLQESLPQRLNSPSKPNSPVKTSQILPTEGEISSAKSEQINSALVAMLTENRLTRQSSHHADDRQSSRRKRTALGRAVSNATDPTRNSRHNSPEKTDSLSKEQPLDLPLPSQKIVYQERESNVRHQRLMAELGGVDIVEVSALNDDSGLTLASVTKPSTTSRSKARRRD